MKVKTCIPHRVDVATPIPYLSNCWNTMQTLEWSYWIAMDVPSAFQLNFRLSDDTWPSRRDKHARICALRLQHISSSFGKYSTRILVKSLEPALPIL